ncbi:hypothetical protein [Candidatus Binatus sp.]|uniref:hypothetical protein n=1 Tax=Candidatus Binatus sp. TaxID=2811406 RepID=UPI003BB055D3
MSRRHAAALALVGFYLIVPTFTRKSAGYSLAGPMKRVTFDSYQQCVDYREALIDLLVLANSPTARAVSECTESPMQLVPVN